jgi:NOL1/NOP2/fmu family ribosome biogenesis protein
MAAEPTEAERVAELHQQAAADYARAQDAATQAAARDQLALARAHGNESAGTA